MSAQARIARTDALHLDRHVERGSVELLYMDPPFAVGERFRARGASGQRADGPVAYDDTWPSLEHYIDWLDARLEVAWPLLGPQGSLWLHLDHRAVHEAKVRASQRFGAGSFRGEIIWIPGNGSKARLGPGMTHQTILIFAKRELIWNVGDPWLREPFAETSLAMHFTHVDADGRRYRERVVNGKAYRYFADEGRAIGSVWSDCPSMASNTPLRRETTGYPTQKPEKLLTRIVRAASHEGGLVVDPFMGSGTTVVAALKQNRRAFGSDIGELSMQITRDRLLAAGLQLTGDDAR